MFQVSYMRRILARTGLVAAGLALSIDVASGQDCVGNAADENVELYWQYARPGRTWFALHILNRPQHELILTHLALSTYGVTFDHLQVYDHPNTFLFDVEEVDTGDGIRFDYTLAISSEVPTASGSWLSLSGRPPGDPNQAPPAYMHVDAQLAYGIRDVDTGEDLAGVLDFVSIRAFDCDVAEATAGCSVISDDCDGNGRVDACDIADGTAGDCNENGLIDACACPGDLNGDRYVGMDDLARVLRHFGGGVRGDLNCDGGTDLTDLAILLANTGPCPE